MMLLLLQACGPAAWPYAVEPRDKSAAGFAHCMFREAHERVLGELQLSELPVRLIEGGYVYLGDAEYLWADVGEDGTYDDWCPWGSGEALFVYPPEPDRFAWCSGAGPIYKPVSPQPDYGSGYECLVEEHPNRLSAPITEWALDSTDLGVTGWSEATVLTAALLPHRGGVPAEVLAEVPEGRALYLLEGADAPLQVGDGVTGEVLYEREAEPSE